MRVLRSLLLLFPLVGVPATAVLVPTDAQASVSIAIAYDALVKDADAVGIATPAESKTVWEDGRIITYTRMKVEQGVAGALGTGSEAWVRTLGGVVGKIGQMVDGEPVFTTGKSSLLFLRKFKGTGTWEVSARAQGQYPVLTDETSKARRVIRSGSLGALFAPRPTTAIPATTNVTAATDTKTQSTAAPAATEVKAVRLAGEVIHDRPLDEVAREVAASWKKLHPATTDTKK